MHFGFVRPKESRRKDIAIRGKEEGFNVEEELVGSTKDPTSFRSGTTTRGYRLQVHHSKIGRGLEAHAKAIDCLNRWEQFQLGWAEVDPNTRVEVGQGVCVCAKTFSIWTANPLQITYVEQEKQEDRKVYAFGHTTQKGHMLRGEERFEVSWDKKTDDVTYRVLSISKPANWLSTLTYPAVCHFQERFARESAKRMAEAVNL